MSTPATPSAELEVRMTNAIRFLAIDAIETAKSGHPGAPMGMAEIAQVLWHRHLRHNPNNPHWPNRDRFVLSNGHGSMLIYALLHLSGYDLPIAELKNFRKLHSRTPGHPEVGLTPGVETTTGPLGQGLANAVGMALAEKVLAQHFNRPGMAIVDHHTYVFLGDGCLMEGISHEVCSLAGTLRLSKLIAFYDDNGISIDGPVSGWFTDDTPARFAAYDWKVIANIDGHDPAAIDAAVRAAQAQSRSDHGRPTLICCKTVIGKGAPNKAGTHDVHGVALGAAETQASRTALRWPYAPFVIPEDVQQAWDARARGAQMQQDWEDQFKAYQLAQPELAAEYMRRTSATLKGKLSDAYYAKLAAVLTDIAAKPDAIATRKASQNALDALAPLVPEFFGGSADLTGSNLTNFKGCTPAGRDHWGNHLSYGVREFGMAAIMNGMALHGGLIPYGGTFLTFSDYSRNAIRMAALMRQRVIHVFTHDSIGLGEDGPTHQSVEHVPSLRLIPHLDVWRPADGLETAVAWACAIERHDGPSALVLSRQNLPAVHNNTAQAGAIGQGGYVLSDMDGAQAVLIATGSEVSLALQTQTQLKEQGVATRVVSMPCTQAFDRQRPEYQNAVLPPHLPAVAIEAAHPDFWHKYVGRTGAILGIAGYGESAPAVDLYRYFGLTADAAAQAVRQVIQRSAAQQ